MKKLLTVVLVFAFVFSLSSAVFADDPVAADPQLKADVKALRAELKELRAQHQQLHEQVVAKHTEIKELFTAAKEAGETEKIDNAKAIKVDVKALNEELKGIREDKKALWAEVKEAKTNKDLETIKAKLTEIIELKKQIISGVEDKLGQLDQIIDALQ